MQSKKGNRGYVMTVVHMFERKSREGECNDNQLSICASETRIGPNLRKTQDENNESHDEFLDKTVSGFLVDTYTGKDIAASEGLVNSKISDRICSNSFQEVQPSPYEYGARPKTNVLKQTYGPKKFKEHSREKRVSLRLDEDFEGPNDDSFSDHRENTTSDCDRSSDYGTMEEEDMTSCDDDDNDIVNERKPLARSEPNLTELNRDEDMSDIRPLRNCLIKVKNSKKFQINQEHGAARLSINNLSDDSGESVLRSVRETNSKVETELFLGGHAYLYRKGYHQLVIFKGSGYGCSFAAKMIFERAVDRGKKEKNAYCFKSAKHACSIGHNEKAVLLVLDANGATGSNMNRLDRWFEFLKERAPIGASSSNTNLTIIMTLQDFPEKQKQVHPIQRKFGEYIVDASEKKYRPSKETKEKLFQAFLEQGNIRVNPMRGSSIILGPGAGKMISLDKDTADGIVPIIGSVRFISKVAAFFQSDLTDGLNSLRTPRPDIVQMIRESHREGGTLFLTLLSVLAHGCQLGVEQINQMRKQNEQAEKFWYSTENINKKSKFKTKNKKRLFDNVHLQHLFSFAKENGHLMNLGDNLQKYACHLDGKFLAEKNNVYRFCDRHVYYSFLLVYCEEYPNALDDCEDDFFFNFVRSSSFPSEEEKMSTCWSMTEI